MRKSIFPVAILATLILSPLKADSPDPTVREPGVNAPAARAIQGVPGGVPVNISGTINASSSCHATALAPTYIEATDNALSCDLAGTLRTSAGGGGGGSSDVAIHDNTTPTRHLAVDASGQIGINNFPFSFSIAGQPLTEPQGLVTTFHPTYGTGAYHDLSLNTLGGLRVDGSDVTQPVSGTFWQATQPVSSTQLPAALDGLNFKVHEQGTVPVTGTFWQATQPVSGPLTDTQLRASAVPVSGTFWQATQPVSGSVSVSNFPASQAVTGTFWQATQPVSGTFWQATQPVSGTFWQATQPVSGTVTDTQGTTPWIGQPQDIAPTTGTLTTNVSTVPATLGHGEAVCGLVTTGTWTTNTAVVFEGSIDGTNFVTQACWGNLSGNFFTQTTANGSWLCPAAGYKKIQVRVNAGTWTGTANVQYTCTLGAQPPTALGITGVVNGNNPTAITNNSTVASAKGDDEGRLYVRDYGFQSWQNIGNATTTSAVLKTNVAGKRLHVTDIYILTSGGSSPTFRIAYGTGATCGTGTTSLTPTWSVVGTFTLDLRTPLIAAASNDVCILLAGVTAPTTSWIVSGYVAQ